MDDRDTIAINVEWDERMFAYGENQLGECGCPATQAGVENMSEINIVTGYYDAILKDKNDAARGLVPEDEARESWLKAIEKLLDAEYEQTKKHVERAKDVATELGWLDE